MIFPMLESSQEVISHVGQLCSLQWPCTIDRIRQSFDLRMSALKCTRIVLGRGCYSIPAVASQPVTLCMRISGSHCSFRFN